MNFKEEVYKRLKFINEEYKYAPNEKEIKVAAEIVFNNLIKTDSFRNKIFNLRRREPSNNAFVYQVIKEMIPALTDYFKKSGFTPDFEKMDSKSGNALESAVNSLLIKYRTPEKKQAKNKVILHKKNKE